MLGIFSRRRKRQKKGQKLYEQVVQAARGPEFFGSGRVPDTVDGRFEVLVLHVFLVTRRLRMANPEGRPDQLVFDAFIQDMDGAVRELGVGDTLVGKRVKRMAQAFYGRSARYLEALEAASGEELQQALQANLLATAETADARFVVRMTKWMQEADRALKEQSEAQVFESGPDFPHFTS